MSEYEPVRRYVERYRFTPFTDALGDRAGKQKGRPCGASPGNPYWTALRRIRRPVFRSVYWIEEPLNEQLREHE